MEAAVLPHLVLDSFEDFKERPRQQWYNDKEKVGLIRYFNLPLSLVVLRIFFSDEWRKLIEFFENNNYKRNGNYFIEFVDSNTTEKITDTKLFEYGIEVQNFDVSSIL